VDLVSISIDPANPLPLRRQLYSELRKVLVSGKVPLGSRLPSSRKLAGSLNLSRTTVVEVFEELISEGVITGRTGSGTFVSCSMKRQRPESAVQQHLRLSARGNRIVATNSASRSTGNSIVGAFRNGVPALDAFPNDVWARHLTHAARNPTSATLDYGDPAGLLRLRHAIAERLVVTRGIQCGPEQVIIVAGTQQAMDYSAQLLVDEGDAVCVEDPGYGPTRNAFLAAGARLAPAPVDEFGLNVGAAKELEAKPKIIVVTPSHQYPLAVTLSGNRRLEILDWAQSAEAWIIEDDYESEFRYDGRSLDALQSMDAAGRVIYVGTFSKTLFPSLRIGYVIAPPALVPAFTAIARLNTLSSKLLEHTALASLLESGDYAFHVHRMRKLYDERQRCLIEQIESRIGSYMRIAPAQSGLHLFASLSPEVSDKAVASLAAESDVYVAPTSGLSIDVFCNGLVLGFAAAPPEEIVRCATILAECIDRVANDAAAERGKCSLRSGR